MTEPITHRCARCRGTSVIPREMLIEGERRRMADLERNHVECPTCAPFGPFGLVPASVCVEGALIGKRPRYFEEEQREDWVRWFLEE